MADVLAVDLLNAEELIQALKKAPYLAAEYLEVELDRAAGRVRKKFMAEGLNGPPGIDGGMWKKQYKRHIKLVTSGTDLPSLQTRLALSRFLSLHETGGVVTAHNKGREMLRLPIGDRWKLPTRGGREIGGHIRGLILVKRPGKMPILAMKEGQHLIPKFVLVNKVVMKPRLGFRESLKRHWPEEYQKLQQTLARAVRVAVDQQVKDISSVIQRLVA